MKWTWMSLQTLDTLPTDAAGYAGILPKVREAGFVAMDATPQDIERAGGVDAYLRALAGAELAVADYIYTTPIQAHDLATWEQAVQAACQAADTALRLGTNNLMIVPDLAHEDLKLREQTELRERMITALRRICDYAASRGVHVMCEDFPVPLLPMCSSDDMEALLSAVPALSLVLDTGNTLAKLEQPTKLFDTLRTRIRHMHFKDIGYGRAEDCWDHDMNGRGIYNEWHGGGIVDFRPIIAGLLQDGYDGYATVEYGPKPGTKDHFAQVALGIQYLDRLEQACRKEQGLA